MSSGLKLQVTRWTWRKLILELRRRGRGRRESGAFLLGDRDGDLARVREFVCYDDLDPSSLDTGAVTFHGEGLKALWALCRQRQLEVVADVHTHPWSDTRQSRIDSRHPMIPVSGHLALIVPNFAYTSPHSLAGVGIHEYGDSGWKSFSPTAVPGRLELTWWH